ncbi:MAG: zinc ribbon domain-containing protein [Syntrophorhabdaceae bacterium]|nr:zinc ribbon domain-containing protein [Syntrophorhabdaceae bacterium]
MKKTFLYGAKISRRTEANALAWLNTCRGLYNLALGQRITAWKNFRRSVSGCGGKVAKSLSVRTHRCPHCGLTLDRDENAAINIKALGQRARALTRDCPVLPENPVSFRGRECQVVSRPDMTYCKIPDNKQGR